MSRHGRALAEILIRVRAARSKLLILDFDGTLAGIAGSPGDVILDPRTDRALARLVQTGGYRIAVISGRSLSDLLTYFRHPKIFYAGNHGLEFKGPGPALPYQAQRAKQLIPMARLLCRELDETFAGIPGVLLENKGLTLSLHHRRVSRSRQADFELKVEAFRKSHKGWPFIWRRGKKVWEARPAIRWNKGDTASLLAKRYPRSLPVVIGDDETDEDMFRAMKDRAVTIHVGRSSKTAAKYRLRSADHVRQLLEALVG